MARVDDLLLDLFIPGVETACKAEEEEEHVRLGKGKELRKIIQKNEQHNGDAQLITEKNKVCIYQNNLLHRTTDSFTVIITNKTFLCTTHTP